MLKSHLTYQFKQVRQDVSSFLLPPIFLIILITLVGISGMQVTPEWIWVGILLSILLQLPHVFNEDARDGTLHYMQSANQLFEFIWAKFIAWLLFLMLPLLLALPIAAILASFDVKMTSLIAASVIFASPSIIWLGLFGGALATMTKQNVLILVIIVLPLLIPIVLLSIISLNEYVSLIILLACDVFLATFMPFIIIYCLKITNQ